MKSVSCFRDLNQFGIRMLTGEADALGYRILCDLDEQGVRVFKECFGMPVPSQMHLNQGLASNWNSGAIASVMLTEDSIRPLAIMGFYLQGRVVVVTRGAHGQVFALEEGEDVVLNENGDAYNLVTYGEDGTVARWPTRYYGEICRIIRPRKSDGRVVQGTRNVHQISGRVS